MTKNNSMLARDQLEMFARDQMLACSLVFKLEMFTRDQMQLHACA